MESLWVAVGPKGCQYVPRGDSRTTSGVRGFQWDSKRCQRNHRGVSEICRDVRGIRWPLGCQWDWDGCQLVLRGVSSPPEGVGWPPMCVGGIPRALMGLFDIVSENKAKATGSGQDTGH